MGRMQNRNYPVKSVLDGPLLRYCEYFPEEFSILATLKLNESAGQAEQEALFALVELGSSRIKLAVRIHK